MKKIIVFAVAPLLYAQNQIFDFCVRNINPNNETQCTLVTLKSQQITLDSIWQIPKTVNCACNAWTTSIRVATPGVSTGGINFATCSVVGNSLTTSNTKTIPAIEMPTSIPYFPSEKPFASIRNFFQKEVKGIWRASLYCRGGNEKLEFTYEFKARIIGECPDSLANKKVE